MSHCFDRRWIDGFKAQPLYSRINPPLLEKMIHALSLLQYLQVHGLSFIFKGGTSLILLLDKSYRFSVDIDIITEASQQDIEKVLDGIVANSHFKSWKLDTRRSYQSGIPKAHYEIEYDSHFNKNSNNILLDILFEKSHYPVIRRQAIESPWIQSQTLIEIDVPTIEGITGDKLTAFAPSTTGILYNKKKELEIIKQLYDLGNLFDKIEDVSTVAASYAAFARQEMAYRSLNLSQNEILLDTIDTCRILSYRDRNRHDPDKSRFLELQSGIKKFDSFLFAGRFTIDEAITAAGKVAYLTKKLLENDYRPLERYNGQDLNKFEIKDPLYSALNRLKRLPDPSGFFYWYQFFQLQ